MKQHGQSVGNSLVLSCGRGSERELEGTDRLRQRGKQQEKRERSSRIKDRRGGMMDKEQE